VPRPAAFVLAVAATFAGTAALAALAVLPAGASARAGVTVPPGIDSTGATDVTDALNQYLAQVAPGSTVDFAPNGRYRIDGTLVLQRLRDVTLDGHGATFFAVTDGSGVAPPRGGQRASWPRLREQWRIRGGSGITLRDMTIRGANANGGATARAYVPRLEGQAGIGIQRASGVMIDSVDVTNTYGDAVYVTGASTNVTVRHSTLERTGRQGVAIVSGQHVVVEDNDIRDIAHSVFDLEPPGRAQVRDIHLQDNRVGAYVNFLLSSGGGGPGVGDVWLQGNRVDGGHGVSAFAGVEGQQRTGLHVLDNVGTGARRPANGTGRAGLLQLLNLDQVEIRGNRQPVGGVPAITTDRVCGLTIAGNQFPGASTEHQQLRACGAAASTPSGGSRPPAPSARPPASAAPAPATTADGGGDSTSRLVIGGLVGFGLGLAAAGVAFAVWRRRRTAPSA
jgi:hypothetical protein